MSSRPKLHAFTLVELLAVFAIIAILASLVLPGLSRAKASAHLAQCASNERQIGLAAGMYVSDHSSYTLHAQIDGALTDRRTYWPDFLLPYIGQSWIAGPVFRCPGNRFQTNWNHDRYGPGSTAVFGNYDMNVLGMGEGSWERPGLGIGKAERFGAMPPWFLPVRESEVHQPSDMIAYGDSVEFTQPTHVYYFSFRLYRGPIVSSSRKGYEAYERKRHGGKYNVLFCDGHVESQKPGKLFSEVPENLRRWNRDNLPHRDYLPALAPLQQ